MGTTPFLYFWTVSTSACRPLRLSCTEFPSPSYPRPWHQRNDRRMTPNFQAPLRPRPRAYLPGNQLLASNRRVTTFKSHPYIKTGGWGANHELLHQLVLILLVCLFVFEIVGCAGGLKGGTTTTGTGSGSTSSGNGSGNGTGGSGTATTIPGAPTGVIATAGNAQVAIAWMASAGATSYHVKRGTAGAGPFTQISAPT